MFTAKRMENFCRDFGATVEVKSEIVDGKVRWNGNVKAQGKTLAEATTDSLGDIPCALAEGFRKNLSEARKEKDPEKLPEAQKVALSKGIPGIAKPRAFDGKPKGLPALVPFSEPT